MIIAIFCFQAAVMLFVCSLLPRFGSASCDALCLPVFIFLANCHAFCLQLLATCCFQAAIAHFACSLLPVSVFSQLSRFSFAEYCPVLLSASCEALCLQLIARFCHDAQLRWAVSQHSRKANACVVWKLSSPDIRAPWVQVFHKGSRFLQAW